jgi:hypothetical protein
VEFELGDRMGSFVLLRDSESGEWLAVRPNGISAVLESQGRTILLLPGGRMSLVDADLARVLRWLSLPGAA